MIWSNNELMNAIIDAHSGELVMTITAFQRQSPVAIGNGVLGDRKKLSVRVSAGRYVADDQLRPPLLITFDMRGDWRRVYLYMRGLYQPTASDLASSSSTTWTDPAVVDAHAYLGWTYDYYFKRFGRRGLDDQNAPIYAITHPIRRGDAPFLDDSILNDFAVGAFWCGSCGTGPRRGAMFFGEGLPSGWTYRGQYVDYLAGALDVIAHELTHGLTQYSSGLIYRNESGALNEAFSDILGTSAEFYYQSPGSGSMQADYLVGEDIFRPGGIRSMANPQAFGDPDHYSRRYRGSLDGGGVHINSGIPNQAFYLAIEGGANRTSGMRVTGVGGSNREQIEKVFFRAFVYMLPSNATFHIARLATLQAARELYGSGSPAERAVSEAWTAVGVN